MSDPQEIALRLIDDAQRRCVYDVDWRLAGYLRDSWRRPLTWRDTPTCLYTARVVISQLPTQAPHLTPTRFDAEVIAPWKARATSVVRTRLERLWAQYPGAKYRRYRLACGWRMYRRALRLVPSAVELADEHSWNLSLHLIMYERPEPLAELLRCVRMEIGEC